MSIVDLFYKRAQSQNFWEDAMLEALIDRIFDDYSNEDAWNIPLDYVMENYSSNVIEYIKNVMRRRNIKNYKDPMEAAYFAADMGTANIRKGLGSAASFPEAEELIATDGEAALYYALRALQDEFVLGNEAIKNLGSEHDQDKITYCNRNGISLEKWGLHDSVANLYNESVGLYDEDDGNEGN